MLKRLIPFFGFVVLPLMGAVIYIYLASPIIKDYDPEFFEQESVYESKVSE